MSDIDELAEVLRGLMYWSSSGTWFTYDSPRIFSKRLMETSWGQSSSHGG